MHNPYFALAVLVSAPFVSAQHRLFEFDNRVGTPQIAGNFDFDNDGVNDVLVASNATRTGPFLVDLYSGANGQPIGLISVPHTVTDQTFVVGGVADTDGDGRDDVAVASPEAQTIRIYPGSGGSARLTIALPNIDEVVLANAGDIDGDGDGDLIAGLPTLGGLGAAIVYSGATGAQLARQDSLGVERFGSSVAGIGDFDGDGSADWAAGGSDGVGDQFVVVSGADASHLLSGVNLGGALVARAGDLDGDGRDDLLVGQSGAGATSLIAFSSVSQIPLWQRLGAVDARIGTSAVGIGDLDGDGRGDVAAYVERAGSIAAAIDVLSGVDGTRLMRLTLSASGAGSVDRAGDLDGDGRPDIVVAATGTAGFAQVSSLTPVGQRPYERIFGVSCVGGGLRHPLIGHGGQPTPLGGFTVELEHASPNANATLLIGTRTGVALDSLGLYGCVLFVNPFATIATSTDSFGRAGFEQGVSFSAAMQGLEIDYQWVSTTPPQGGLPLQLSAGMRVGFSM